MTPSTICKSCNGTGHRQISKENARTLAVLHELGEATIAQVRSKLKGVSLVATHRRMQRMESAKLIRQKGRKFPRVFEVVSSQG